MKKIRLIQIDGKLPNLALMKLSHWHKSKGDEVVFTRRIYRDMFDQDYDKVYASSIFKWSKPSQDKVLMEWPGVVTGGTGFDLSTTVENTLGINVYENYDYSIYPDCESSIGFSMRGCRLRCGFCVVSQKEGKPKDNLKINEIWRGQEHKKNIVLLDNDFFGQPEKEWRSKIGEMIDGKFKVSFNQGLNIRLINPAACKELANVKYYDDSFSKRRLYTAWDSHKDEKIFERGMRMLQDAGIPPRHLMVYMLIGYDKGETMDDIFRRYDKLIEWGCMPYPMVYDRKNKEHCYFQRWAIRYARFVKWEDFDKPALRVKSLK